MAKTPILGDADNLPEVRRQRLLELVRKSGKLTTAGLVQALGASVATVRRDLAALEDLNLVKRTHGGVIGVNLELGPAAPTAADYEPGFSDKRSRQREEKDAIAAAAARLVDDGATVLLDSGTTCLALARLLAGRRLTVVALDLNAAIAVAHGATEVLMAGGRVRPGLYNVVGPWTDAVLRDLMVDTFFMGADGISELGVTNSAVDEARVKAMAMKSAGRCVVLADHTKFNVRKLAPVCALDAVDVFVTDRATDALVEPYRSSLRRIVYA
ncbi:MAG: DeoR/GlpR transcriptional regulator [Burkholderiales bacterium]|nr:DeoR/GlpR transcriptional regulator [Burkholderiales bacterium]